MSSSDESRSGGRSARDRAGRSPASEEAKQQGHSGEQGGPRAAQAPGSGQRQPPQGTQRVSNVHAAEAREGFAPGEAPSEQGEGEPSAETIKQRQQGLGQRSGSHSAHGERSEQAATGGEPQGEHTRHGRQHEPGDRSSQRPA